MKREKDPVIRELERRRRQAKWATDEPIILSQKQFRSLRPSRNVVVLALWVCLGAVSTLQIMRGPSPDSVNANLDLMVQDSLAGAIITVSVLNIAAAFVPHSGISLGLEIGAMLFGVAGFLVYLLVIIDVDLQPWTTAGFAWSAALFIGCGLRVFQIFRRGY